MSKLNNLNIIVFNCALGDKNGYVQNDNQVSEDYGHCSYKTTESGIKLLTLDEFADIIGNVGFIHVDVEGWESNVLKGANKLLSSSNLFILILECWTNYESKQRGFSENPERDILDILKMYSNLIQLNDINDCERNLCFYKFK